MTPEARERKRARDANYRRAHREELAAKARKYHQDNREKILEAYQANREQIRIARREYRQKNHDRLIASARKYYQAHREKYVEHSRVWYRKNRDSAVAAMRVRKATPAAKIREYKRSAQRRSISFELTFEQFAAIVTCPCWYCGKNPAGGVDRLNNEPYYRVENSVPCCEPCNRAKLQMRYAQFVSHCAKIVWHAGHREARMMTRTSRAR